MTQQALDAGSGEAILLRDGQVLEGASTNVFVVLDDVLYTAPQDRRILAGITRDLIVELVPQYPLPLREQCVAAADLVDASEIWISSSTREMVPVTSLDGNRSAAAKSVRSLSRCGMCIAPFVRDQHASTVEISMISAN